jgi:hypothetical protein
VIGPALYPYWWFGVKTAVTIQVAVALVAFLLRCLSGDDIAVAWGHAMTAAINGSLVLIGFATVAAWIVERRGVNIDYLDRWRVRDLRFLQFAAFDLDTLRDKVAAGSAWRPRPAQPFSLRAGKRQSPARRGLGLIAGGAVLALWWTGMLHFVVIGHLSDLRDLGIEPGDLGQISWGALRDALYWPVLGYCLLLMLLGATLLARPDAIRLHGVGDIVIGAVVMAITLWLWTASPLAAATQVDSLSGFFRLMARTFQQGPPFPLSGIVTFCLAMNAFGAVCRIARGLWEVVAPMDANPIGGWARRA